MPSISIAAHEGRFLQLLVRSNNAKKALEIGTLGGYSGIWIARGLDPTGRLITLEKEELHAQVARENFQYAGLDSMIEIRVGDAHEQLENLSDEVPFDFVFIDAEKPGYEDYFTIQFGLAVVNPRCVQRICNIATAVADTFDHHQVIAAMNKMPMRGRGAVAFCNADVMTLVDIAAADKANVNYYKATAFGQETTHVRGVPFLLCDEILSTESTVS